MPRFPFCNLHLLRRGWRGTLPAFLCLKLHLPRPSFTFFFFFNVSHIDKAFNLWSRAAPHLKMKPHKQLLGAVLPGRKHGSHSIQVGLATNLEVVIHLIHTFIRGKKKQQKNSLQELEEKCNGSRKCSCSVGSGCVLPEHPPCTKDAQPHRMALTDPIIGPGGHIRPPTRHRLQAQFHTFWFSSWSGTIVPQGAPKGQELALTALLPREKRHSKMVGMLGIRTRSWGLCGHQCCSEGAGGLGQRGAAQECCDNSRCLQWPFKPDWKLLRIARLTKKAVLGELWNGLCVFNVSQWLGWDSAV